MTKLKLFTIASLLSLGLVGACGKKDEGAAGGGGGGAAKVDVSAEMNNFIGALKGKSADVTSALKANVANEEVKTQDMDMYDLGSPKVTAHNKTGDKDCYTMDAKAGATTRTYDVCWTGGKIVEVVDKGMR